MINMPMTEDILRMILLGSGAILILILIYAVVELVRTLRWIRYTAEDLQPTIKQATEVLEALEPTVKKANEILEALNPSIQRVDPLIERISLTVDAVNLEIMRADQILANLTDVTDVASNAAKKVNTIADTPLNLLTSATDKVRTIFSDRKPESDTRDALNEAGADQPKALQEASGVSAAVTDYVSVESAASAAQAEFPSSAATAATATIGPSDTTAAAVIVSVEPSIADNQTPDGTPPYQDDIDVVEPKSSSPQWPF
jgi:uncharacterized protein YoxC